ncbi:MAG: hypothetical protein AAFQ43_02510, partial [Bacteroidota bacterium]
QRRVYELLREDFDVYFSTVQLETECLERDPAREIDAWREAPLVPWTAAPEPERHAVDASSADASTASS